MNVRHQKQKINKKKKNKKKTHTPKCHEKTQSLKCRHHKIPWTFKSQPQEAVQFIIDNELTRKTSDVIG